MEEQVTLTRLEYEILCEFIHSAYQIMNMSATNSGAAFMQGFKQGEWKANYEQPSTRILLKK